MELRTADCYSILELNQDVIEQMDETDCNSSADRLVKGAYRKLGSRYHPDKCPDPDAAEKFNRVKHAYDNLCSRNQRINYKQDLKRRQSRQPSLALVTTLGTAVVPFQTFQEDNDVSSDELETELARLILSLRGEIFVGSSDYKAFIDRPGYKKKMRELGNPSRFCESRGAMGFSFIPCTSRLGHKIRFDPGSTPCHKWMRGFCPHGMSCRYSHEIPRGCAPPNFSPDVDSRNSVRTEEEQKPSAAGVSQKTGTPCKFFKQGNCKYGATCKNLHESNERVKEVPDNANDRFRTVRCRYFAKGRCRDGSNCPFLHEQPAPGDSEAHDTPSSPQSKTESDQTSFNWEQHRGHKKILIVGGTGHGKSTFINSLHNFFNTKSLDEIEVIIPTAHLQPKSNGIARHTERGVPSDQSQTQDCTEYVFHKPGDRQTSITFIDTPGLADTRGLTQDEENINKIIEVAARAETDGTLTGLIFVMKGTENRSVQSIKLITTILKSSLPDYILSTMMILFTICPTKASCQSRDLIPFPVEDMNCFYFDNPVFLRRLSSLDRKDRAHYARCWTDTMAEINDILLRIFDMPPPPRERGFSQLLTMRMKAKAMFHEIKNHVQNLQKVMNQLEEAEAQYQRSQKHGEETRNYLQEKTITQKVLVDSPFHSTLCSACEHVCHKQCGLNEITTAGSNSFTRCAAFHGNNNCHRCPQRCGYTHHYHARKLVEEKTQKIQEVIDSLKREHEAALADMNLANRSIQSATQFRALVDRDIQSQMQNLDVACRGILAICSNFNLVDELNVTLGELRSEAKRITNTQALQVHNNIITAITTMINSYSTLPPSTNGPS